MSEWPGRLGPITQKELTVFMEHKTSPTVVDPRCQYCCLWMPWPASLPETSRRDPEPEQSCLPFSPLKSAHSETYCSASVISSLEAVLPEATDFMPGVPGSPGGLFSQVLSSSTQPTSDFVLCFHKDTPDLRMGGCTAFLCLSYVLQPLIPIKEKEIHMVELKTTADLNDYRNQ